MSEITSKNIVQDERLREQNFGIHENIPIDKWIEMAVKAKVDPLDFPPETGETNVDVRNRTREFLKNAVSKVSYFIIHLVFNQYFSNKILVGIYEKFCSHLYVPLNSKRAEKHKTVHRKIKIDISYQFAAI